jgi:hypothetical protein
MKRFCSLPAALLLFSAVLLAPASTAWASITYSIVDYPQSQTDLITGGLDHVTGSITTDGVTGIITYADITSVTIIITTPSDTFSTTFNPSPGSTSSDYLMASSTMLYLQGAGDLFLTSGTSNQTQLIYIDGPPNDIPFHVYQGFDDNSNNLFTTYEGTSPPIYAGASSPGNYIGETPMIIAEVTSSVPEPTTITIWVLLGLAGSLYLRRRGAKA